MKKSRINVLFVSRRNTVRSILAQACLNHLGRDRFHAYSCGMSNEIRKRPNPATVTALSNAGILDVATNCVGWDKFTKGSAPIMHWVIVLDEDVHRLVPRWPGQPDSALWAYPDILNSEDGTKMVEAACSKFLLSIHRRLEILTNLPLNGSDQSALRSDIRDLGRGQ